MPRRKYQTPEIMHDAPLTDSKAADFHFDDFAATLARLIASPNSETPLAIGINGAWGSGKTSLLLRVKHMLDKPKGEDGKGEHRFAHGEEKDFRKCKTVWFDAWKYNEEKELLVALVRVILQAMKKDGLMNKLNAWLEDPSQPAYDSVAMFINAFEISFGGLGLGLKFKADPQKHQTPSKFEQYTAFFDYFNEAFEKLLALWVHGKSNFAEIEESQGALVIFIDDLDRCLPSKTVQALEALKLFLDKSGCVFVLGADTRIVQMAVEAHYKNTGITGESAKDYLEKIIQLRFDIPPIVEKVMEDYLKVQSKENRTKVDEAMLNRWQALVAAAEVNPRRVKNVINDLNLQWFMAVNSGQAEGVNRDDFICWQALMRAAPKIFVDHVRETLEDSERRHSFIMDALKWQQGKQEDKELVKGYFSAYEEKDSKRLRGVLKQISFSNEFTPDALDAIIYMVAPPTVISNIGGIAYGTSSGFGNLIALQAESEKPLVEESKKAVESVSIGGEVALEGELEYRVIRGEKEPMHGDQNLRVIGGLNFVRVPAGKFVMGSKDDNELAVNSEKPQHTVDLTYEYWISRFILTNDQYAEYLGKKRHPVSDWQKKKDYPVVNVSWNDAMDYCRWFNENYKSDLGDLLSRLPSEAEWEKAARGAYGNEWPWGNEFDASKCNSAEGKKGGTTPVGVYSTWGGDSPYGCSDMVGNVWEWCHDWFSDSEYQSRISMPVVNPKGSQSGYYRALRGGSFSYFRNGTRCAYRIDYNPDKRDLNLGFRLVISPSVF